MQKSRSGIFDEVRSWFVDDPQGVEKAKEVEEAVEEMEAVEEKEAVKDSSPAEAGKQDAKQFEADTRVAALEAEIEQLKQQREADRKKEEAPTTNRFREFSEAELGDAPATPENFHELISEPDEFVAYIRSLITRALKEELQPAFQDLGKTLQPVVTRHAVAENVRSMIEKYGKDFINNIADIKDLHAKYKGDGVAKTMEELFFEVKRDKIRNGTWSSGTNLATGDSQPEKEKVKKEDIQDIKTERSGGGDDTGLQKKLPKNARDLIRMALDDVGLTE